MANQYIPNHTQLPQVDPFRCDLSLPPPAARVRNGSSARPSKQGFAVRLTSLAQVPALNRELKETTHRFPQVLTGAQAALFTAGTSFGNLDEATIEAQWLKTSETKTLVGGGSYGRYVQSGHLLYVRQGRYARGPCDAARVNGAGGANGRRRGER